MKNPMLLVHGLIILLCITGIVIGSLYHVSLYLCITQRSSIKYIIGGNIDHLTQYIFWPWNIAYCLYVAFKQRQKKKRELLIKSFDNDEE